VEYRLELETAIRAARAAGEVIAGHYAKGSHEIHLKADASPVTQADRDADAVIAGVLRAAFPDDAILSEETPDDLARLSRSRVWIVDPLDGTRDFVGRTDDFAVHVALTVDGVPVVGAVYLPVPAAMYSASSGGGAWREAGGARERLHVSATADRAALRIGISRHHLSDRLRACLDTAQIASRIPTGASVKHMRVASGDLDAVINLSSGELEWDTCAPEIVIREAGGSYSDGDGLPFRYNQRNLEHERGSVASNGACHAELLSLLAPYLP
jgi:3'(2'), 5'-bisphosphate nucleotidase